MTEIMETVGEASLANESLWYKWYFPAVISESQPLSLLALILNCNTLSLSTDQVCYIGHIIWYLSTKNEVNWSMINIAYNL